MRLGAIVAPDVHRQFELAQRRLAPFIIERAGLGDGHAARVAVEKPAIQRLLDRGDVLGHGRLGHGEVVGGARKTAGLDDPHERPHARQPIHPPSPHCRRPDNRGSMARSRPLVSLKRESRPSMIAAQTVTLRQREGKLPPKVVAALTTSLAARFGNKLVTSEAVRMQHGHTLTWIAECAARRGRIRREPRGRDRRGADLRRARRADRAVRRRHLARGPRQRAPRRAVDRLSAA